jgi:tetrahydromethanopterin S-methyltransferase subunit G
MVMKVDNFKAVYKILSTLEKSMDYPEMDLMPLIGAEKLGVRSVGIVTSR